MANPRGSLNDQLKDLRKSYSDSVVGFTLLSGVHHYLESQRKEVVEKMKSLMKKEDSRPTNRTPLTNLAIEHDLLAQGIEEVVKNIRYLHNIYEENKTGKIYS